MCRIKDIMCRMREGIYVWISKQLLDGYGYIRLCFKDGAEGFVFVFFPWVDGKYYPVEMSLEFI